VIVHPQKKSGWDAVADVDVRIKAGARDLFRAGDEVEICLRRGSESSSGPETIFGTVLAYTIVGADRLLIVRSQAEGEPVDRAYSLNSPEILKIERTGPTKRAKLQVLAKRLAKTGGARGRKVVFPAAFYGSEPKR
jgi:ribosomal protein L19